MTQSLTDFAEPLVDEPASGSAEQAKLEASWGRPSWSGVWNGVRGLRVVVSVDWEGSGFDAKDLAAFCQFRDDFPNVPLTQFLNAAYFTRLAPNDEAGAKDACDQIRTVLRDGDEIGLHVHADNHLLYAAGVAPKKFPSWDNLPDMTGHSVPLSAFSEEEVRRVVAFSCGTLEQHGFDRPSAFRAGGWHAGSSVLNALAAEGFAVDSSEVPHDWLPRNFGDVEDLWPNATRVSQPYRVRGGLVEVPDNGCLADYVTSDQMVETFEEVLQSQSGKPVVLSLGFHQETAAKFLPRLRSALLEMELRAATRGVPMRYDCMRDVALTVKPWPEAEAGPAEAAAEVEEGAAVRGVAGEAATAPSSATSSATSLATSPAMPAAQLTEAEAKAAWLAKQDAPITSRAVQTPTAVVAEATAEMAVQVVTEAAAEVAANVAVEEVAAEEVAEEVAATGEAVAEAKAVGVSNAGAAAEAAAEAGRIVLPPPDGFVWGGTF